MEGYKLFTLHPGKQLHNLHHGIRGSKVMPQGKWIVAEKKVVTDGSRSKKYLSGIHFFGSLGALKKYSKFNHPNQVICRIQAEGVRRKTWSRVPLFLADRIMILELVEIIHRQS